MELLERAAFLQTLAEYAGEARQGDGRLVLVSGESGMGKTVLLEEFQPGYDQALGHADPWTFGSVAIWLSRLREPIDLPSNLPEPFARERAGDWRGAAAAWNRLRRPTTQPWPGWARRTTLGSGKRCGRSTTWAPGQPPLRPGGA